VCQQEDGTVLCKQGVKTDREDLANKPDIILKNKRDKTCSLIDMAMSFDRNVIQKQAEKKLN
jgi:hypothetical protein